MGSLLEIICAQNGTILGGLAVWVVIILLIDLHECLCGVRRTLSSDQGLKTGYMWWAMFPMVIVVNMLIGLYTASKAYQYLWYEFEGEPHELHSAVLEIVGVATFLWTTAWALIVLLAAIVSYNAVLRIHPTIKLSPE